MQERKEQLEIIYDEDRKAVDEVDEALIKFSMKNRKEEHREPNWKDFNVYVECVLNHGRSLAEEVVIMYSSFYNDTLQNVSFAVKQRIENYLSIIANRNQYGFFDQKQEFITFNFICYLEQLIKNYPNSLVIVDTAFIAANRKCYSGIKILSKIVNSKN